MLKHSDDANSHSQRTSAKSQDSKRKSNQDLKSYLRKKKLDDIIDITHNIQILDEYLTDFLEESERLDWDHTKLLEVHKESEEKLKKSSERLDESKKAQEEAQKRKEEKEKPLKKIEAEIQELQNKKIKYTNNPKLSKGSWLSAKSQDSILKEERRKISREVKKIEKHITDLASTNKTLEEDKNICLVREQCIKDALEKYERRKQGLSQEWGGLLEQKQRIKNKIKEFPEHNGELMKYQHGCLTKYFRLAKKFSEFAYVAKQTQKVDLHDPSISTSAKNNTCRTPEITINTCLSDTKKIRLNASDLQI